MNLVDPPFAKDPPVKMNVNAKTLGLVLLILGVLGLLLAALALIAIIGFCGGGNAIYGTACSLPVIWLLGDLIGLAALVIGTIGAYRMYQGNPEGKLWVIYGLIGRVIAAVISLVGNYSAYSNLSASTGAGAVFGLVIDLAICFIVYYLVVVSRFPGQAPLTASATSWGGGPPAPPPPPPMA